MRGVEGKTGKRRFGFSYALLASAVVAYLGTWAYSSYAAEWQAKAQIPRIDPILKIIKDLRQYQRIKATFPQDFTNVETAIRKHPKRPDYGSGGRSLVVSNYYYFYTSVSPTRCTLWAIPIGPRAEDGNSCLLYTSPSPRDS